MNVLLLFFFFAFTFLALIAKRKENVAPQARWTQGTLGHGKENSDLGSDNSINIKYLWLNVKIILTISGKYWESEFLGRLTRSLGSPRRKMSGAPEEEIVVWSSQGEKDKRFSIFLHLNHIKHCFSLSPELTITQQNNLNSVLRIR